MNRTRLALLITIAIVLGITLIQFIISNYSISLSAIPKIELQELLPKTVDTTVINYKYDNSSVLDVINKYRDYNKYNAVGTNKELSDYADKYNAIIHNDVINGNKRLITVIPESYKISAFAVYKKDLSNDNIGESWVNNKREYKRLMYPYLRNVGISCIRYDDLILCLMLANRNDINNTDMRYWELLVCWYDNYETVK